VACWRGSLSCETSPVLSDPCQVSVVPRMSKMNSSPRLTVLFPTSVVMFRYRHNSKNTPRHHAGQPEHSNPKFYDWTFHPDEGPEEERTTWISISSRTLRFGICKSPSTAQTVHQSQIDRNQNPGNTRNVHREQQILSLSVTRISAVDLISIHEFEEQQSMRITTRTSDAAVSCTT
jgi:hypothetical protein